MKESEEKFRTITENSPDAIFITDLKGNYVYVNQAASSLLGYSFEEFTKMNITDISREEDIEDNLKEFQRILDEEYIFIETNLVKKNGDIIPVDLNAVLLPNGLVYGSCRDLTERKQMEQELHRLEKLNSVGVLAGGIAHDFNNLLTAIFGNIQLAKMSSTNPSVTEKLEEVESASMQAKNLTQRLLTFSEGGAPVKYIQDGVIYSTFNSILFLNPEIRIKVSLPKTPSQSLSQRLAQQR